MNAFLGMVVGIKNRASEIEIHWNEVKVNIVIIMIGGLILLKVFNSMH